jgi:type I restriction enzyme M protein
MKDGVLLRQIIDEISSLNLDDYEESRAFAGVYESILKELQNAGASGKFYTPRAGADYMAEAVEPKIDETADLFVATILYRLKRGGRKTRLVCATSLA